MRVLASTVCFVYTFVLFSQIKFTVIDAGDLTFYPGGNTFDGIITGGTWVDFDKDGDLDFFGSNLFFENDGSNFFKADSLPRSGNIPTVADLNNDGLLDLVATNDTLQTIIYMNQGTSFDEILLGDFNDHFVENDLTPNLDVSFIDVNYDGFLDILISDCYTGNRMYINQSGSSFVLDSDRMLGSSGYSTWADFDNDGDMDLMSDALYENVKVGSFVKKIEIQGVSWGDFNNDGFEDLLGTLNNEIVVYVNNQEGGFLIDTIKTKNSPYLIGSSWGDLDNDGDLDLLVADWIGGHSLFENKGGALKEIGFVESYNETRQSIYPRGIRTPALPMSLTFGDINQDGHLDAFIGYDSATPNLILINKGSSNNWIEVNLEGTTSNYNGIGARVIVEATIDGEVKRQYRQQRIRHGRFAGNLTMHFGLKDSEIVDKLIVEWPSGNVTELRNVNVRQMLTINEDMVTSIVPELETSFIFYPNPSVDDIIIKSAVDYQGVVIIKMYNLRGEEVTSSTTYKGQDPLGYKMRIQNVPSGTYLLKTEFGKQTFTQKIIKE